jgi:hypothetical protein
MPDIWYIEVMKTTVEIPDSLFRQAKQYAARQGVPLREVFERGLRIALQGAPAPTRRFRLKTVTTKGEGLVCDGDWSTIRSLIYEGHGG